LIASVYHQGEFVIDFLGASPNRTRFSEENHATLQTANISKTVQKSALSHLPFQ